MAYYNVPKEYSDCNEMLTRLCEDGLARRIPNADDETRLRLQHELAIIKQKEIADYFFDSARCRQIRKRTRLLYRSGT
jgi:DNA polymerase-3 subunit alpha